MMFSGPASGWRKRSIWAAAALSAVMAAGGLLSGKSIVLRGEVVLDGNEPSKEDLQNVFVRDSAVAREKLELARRMEQYKEWHKSADVYQEVLEKYPDRVVAVNEADQRGVKSRYTSVTHTVIQSLCKWPAEGLDVYRGRYEPRAAEMMRNARPDDLFTLHKVLGLYFVTDSGKQAGLRLIDAHLEKGEYAAAAWIGDQLLDLHPGLLTERPSVLFRTALAYHFAGNADKARERSATLATDFPRDLGVVRGKEVALADVVKEELERDPVAGGPLVAAGGAGSWPMMGGGPSRGVISTASAAAGTRLFSIPLAKPTFNLNGIQPQQRVALQTQLDLAAASGMTTGIMPVADRGELYFQDGQRVYAVGLDSGLPLPAWLHSYPDRNGQYLLNNAVGSSRMTQQSLTLTDDRLIAIMGQPDRQTMMFTGQSPQGEPRLVCLNRATGKEQWTAALSSAADVPKNDDEKTIRALQMSGSPLVVGDSVLVIARGSKQGQGEDCFVLAFELSSGRFRWGCYVASSGAGAAGMFGGNPMLLNDDISHLAYANGRVYVLTNVGAVAALDAYSGAIAWLDIYPMDHPMMGAFPGRFNPGMRRGNQLTERTKPWTFNPVIVQDARLFVLPSESKYLMVYDAGSGKEIKRINLDQLGGWQPENARRDKPDILVGVSGNRMVLANDSRVLCIDWIKYDEESFPGPQSRMVFWPASGPNPPPEGGIRGRPFMTSSSVYVCADDRMRRYSLETGKIQEEYPAFPRTWSEGEGPGNVLAAGDHVIIAGADMVNVYTDLSAAKKKLDREIAASPDDPEHRLRYAEVLFAAGEVEPAIQRLDEAIERLGGRGGMKRGPNRDRAFSDALSFARRTASEARRGNAERVVGLFDRAAAAADNPQQQVQWRFALAEYASEHRDPAAALKRCQEILSDGAMRAVTLLDEKASESGNPAQAEAVAERVVAELIASAGPELYAPYRQQASEAITAARAEADGAARAAKLLEVALSYPNADLAPVAMLGAAEAYEDADLPRMAIRVLRQMLFKYQRSAERPAVLEAIARNYLAIGDRERSAMVSTAAARLAQIVQLPGDRRLDKALKLPDGTVLAEAGAPLSKALDAVRRIAVAEADKTLPDFALAHPPTPEEQANGQQRLPAFRRQSPETVLPDAAALVLPAPDFARSDRVIAWSPAVGLRIYRPGERKPLASSKEYAARDAKAGGGAAIPAAPRGVAWAQDDALVWGGGRLLNLDGRSGKTLWVIDFNQLSPLEVVRASQPAQPPVAVMPNPALAFRGNGRLNRNGVAVNIDFNGNAVAQQQAPAPQVDEGVAPGLPALPVGGGEQVVEVRPVGDRVLVATTTGRLLAIERATGRISWQTRLSDRPVDRLAATEDFTVVKTTDDLSVVLFALDTYSGRLLGARTYAIANGQTPVNLALSAEGTLVYTLPDRLCLKDLYRDWEEEEKVVVGQSGVNLFQGATQPGQLLISEGRILALADGGAGPNNVTPGQKYVRVHSLETGQPLQLKYRAGDAGERQMDLLLTAGDTSWNIMLRTVGSKLYVIGPKSVYSYNLDRPSERWVGNTNSLTDAQRAEMNFRDAFLGREHLVVLDQPAAADPASRTYRVYAYARYPAPGGRTGESGRLDFLVTISDPSGIAPQWQAVDGGFYYATLDGKVHMLLGTADAKKENDAGDAGGADAKQKAPAKEAGRADPLADEDAAASSPQKRE